MYMYTCMSLCNHANTSGQTFYSLLYMNHVYHVDCIICPLHVQSMRVDNKLYTCVTDVFSYPFQNALFGEGTYLSSELTISLMYSPHGRGWSNSSIGTSLSCVAVAEMIDLPSVKCQTKNLKRTDSRSKISGSEGGEIPETYYVVRNNDVIRVKYLLLYSGSQQKRYIFK